VANLVALIEECSLIGVFVVGAWVVAS